MSDIYVIDNNGWLLEVVSSYSSVPPDKLAVSKPLEISKYSKPRFDFSKNDWVEGKSEDDILNDAKKAKFNELSETCQKEILGYFEATVDSVAFSFSFDNEAQLNFTGTLALFIEGLINEVEWTVYREGVVERITLNKEQFLSVIAEGFKHKNSKIARLRNELQPLIDQAATLEEIENISW